MMVTVFDQKVPNLLAREVALVIAINATESCIRFKIGQAAQRLSLALNRELLFCYSQHKTGKA